MADPAARPSPAELADRIERLVDAPDEALRASALPLADDLLAMGEAILEGWLVARGLVATQATAEGFRLLALHRQAAAGDPSFNACRETCRELVYRRNLVQLAPDHPEAAARLRLAAMVARHLALFISGKLEQASFGEFCCSSRPLRNAAGAQATPPNSE